MAITSSLGHFIQAIVDMITGILSGISNAVHGIFQLGVEAINIVLDLVFSIIRFLSEHIFLTIAIIGVIFWWSLVSQGNMKRQPAGITSGKKRQ